MLYYYYDYYNYNKGGRKWCYPKENVCGAVMSGFLGKRPGR
jgi:hypothetical protein